MASKKNKIVYEGCRLGPDKDKVPCPESETMQGIIFICQGSFFVFVFIFQVDQEIEGGFPDELKSSHQLGTLCVLKPPCSI